MKFDNHNQRNRGTQIRNLHETTSGKAAIWIDDDSGKIVDILPIESREAQRRPRRYAFPRSLQHDRPIDLIGRRPNPQATLPGRPQSIPVLPPGPPQLLLGKRGGS
jgi:hypothetical protein